MTETGRSKSPNADPSRKHSPHSPHSPRQNAGDGEPGNEGKEGKVFSDIARKRRGFVQCQENHAWLERAL
jgi:hypothetical protein